VKASQDLADFLHDLAIITRRKLDAGSTYENQLRIFRHEFEFLRVRAESLQGENRERALELWRELGRLLGFEKEA